MKRFKRQVKDVRGKIDIKFWFGVGPSQVIDNWFYYFKELYVFRLRAIIFIAKKSR